MKYRIGAALSIAACVVLLASCTAVPDNRNDPLENYGVQVMVPYATNTPNVKETPKPTPTPTLYVPVKKTDVGWMDEVIDVSEISVYETLEEGMTGQAVKDLQKRLVELGYMPGPASGEFDSDTISAIMRFEEAYGREPTGVATPTMQKYLFSTSARLYTAPTKAPKTNRKKYRQLERGDTGEDVKLLQNRLIELGYMSGSATGAFDIKTEDAVIAFWQNYNKQPTSIATVAMQKALFSDNAKRAEEVKATTKPVVTIKAAQDYTTLSLGSTGLGVINLQNRLYELGYLDEKGDGLFGGGTESAVRAFEKGYGMTPTGVATVALQKQLFADDAKTYAESLLVPTKAPEKTYRELKSGSSGEDVERLQNRLIELGYLIGTADGVYGSGTVNAVKAFEAAYNREETGVATRALQRKLYSLDAKVAPSIYRTLEKGSSGLDVSNLQARLIELGYLTGTPDGVYADNTIAAIKLFQKAMGLKQTGAATEALQKKLFNDDAPRYGETAEKVTSSDDAEETITVNAPAYVTKDNLKIYRSNSTKSGVIATVNSGYKLTWLQTRGKWARVKNASGTKGFCNAAALALESDEWGTDEEQDEAVGASNYKELSYGNTGDYVKKLQSRLKDLGYFTGDIGGNYLDKTISAVKLFQKSIGLEETGIATVSLQEVIFSSAAPDYGDFAFPEKQAYQTINQASSGENVMMLQARLVELGFLDEDSFTAGEYDQNTLLAVVNVQLAMGIEEADGMASVELQAFLYSKAGKNLKK